MIQWRTLTADRRLTDETRTRAAALEEAWRSSAAWPVFLSLNELANGFKTFRSAWAELQQALQFFEWPPLTTASRVRRLADQPAQIAQFRRLTNNFLGSAVAMFSYTEAIARRHERFSQYASDEYKKRVAECELCAFMRELRNVAFHSPSLSFSVSRGFMSTVESDAKVMVNLDVLKSNAGRTRTLTPAAQAYFASLARTSVHLTPLSEAYAKHVITFLMWFEDSLRKHYESELHEGFALGEELRDIHAGTTAADMIDRFMPTSRAIDFATRTDVSS